jgi:hypothetical protein
MSFDGHEQDAPMTRARRIRAAAQALREPPRLWFWAPDLKAPVPAAVRPGIDAEEVLRECRRPTG